MFLPYRKKSTSLQDLLTIVQGVASFLQVIQQAFFCLGLVSNTMIFSSTAGSLFSPAFTLEPCE
jgi:hypothetical protein